MAPSPLKSPKYSVWKHAIVWCLHRFLHCLKRTAIFFSNGHSVSYCTCSLQADLKRLWRKWFPCCKVCPCLRISWNQESTVIIKDYYSKCDKRRSSTESATQGTNIRLSDQSKKLLSVRMNGHGHCETKLNGKNQSGGASSLKPAPTGASSAGSRISNAPSK